MIKVSVDRTGERIKSFTISGHANYARSGQDIVCAGVSAVSFGSINAVEDLTGVVLPTKQANKDGGYMKVDVPVMEGKTDEQIQLLVKGMLSSLETIERDYKKYLKITYIEV